MQIDLSGAHDGDFVSYPGNDDPNISADAYDVDSKKFFQMLVFSPRISFIIYSP